MQGSLQISQYLIAMGIQDRRLTTAILVIPTRPPDRAPRAAPNLLFGSLYGVTYFPTGVTSAVLFSKFSRGIRTWLKDTKLKNNNPAELISLYRHVLVNFIIIFCCDQ